MLQTSEFLIQRFAILYMLGMRINASHGADLYTLRLIKMPHTLGAFVRMDFVNLFAHVYRVVWAFGLADIAVDAFVSDSQSHGSALFMLEALGDARLLAP
jgi:hypothetical protein